MKATLSSRPWWQWALAGLVLLLILGAIFGEDESTDTATETVTVTVTQPAPAAVTPSSTEPTETIADAREAVDEGDYRRAVAIAAALGSAHEQAIRRRIANRIARQVRAAVRDGDRRRASRLLRRASLYPTTKELTHARARYRAAKEQAAARARERREAAAQREAEQRQREEEAQSAPEPAGDCDPGYSGCVPPYPPDVDCPEVDGPVQVLGSDPHGLDRDGDGSACES